MADFKSLIFYQVYPKSFLDTAGQGTGTLEGVRSKLPYFQELGVDMLWLTPVFPSPQRDNGYDVADYCDIDPRYGTLEDMQHLINSAAEYNIGIMLDMVFNHTSTQHLWFQKALAGDPKYQDYYYFVSPKEGPLPPSNWQSKFGGSAWEYLPEKDLYYLHLFDKTQADLNWNNPELRQELAQDLRFWYSMGVKGFRFDVVNLISKPQTWEDDFEWDGRRFYTDGPEVLRYLQELRAASYGDDPDVVTVGELSSTSIDKAALYSKQEQHALSMVFHFHHLKVDYARGQKWEILPFQFAPLKQILNEWQVGMQERNAWSALFWSNHDQPRALSRFGDDAEFRYESATLLATLLLCMRGSPFIYQGEEVGVANPHFDRLDHFKDTESLNAIQALRTEGKSDTEILVILNARSRDNGRIPMPWQDVAYGGFSKAEPWIYMPESYCAHSVAKDMYAHQKSVFRYYQQLIALRKQTPCLIYGTFEEMPSPEDVYCFRRVLDSEVVEVFGNFSRDARRIPLEKGGRTPLLSNSDLCIHVPDGTRKDFSLELAPYQAAIVSYRMTR